MLLSVITIPRITLVDAKPLSQSLCLCLSVSLSLSLAKSSFHLHPAATAQWRNYVVGARKQWRI